MKALAGSTMASDMDFPMRSTSPLAKPAAIVAACPTLNTSFSIETVSGNTERALSVFFGDIGTSGMATHMPKLGGGSKW